MSDDPETGALSKISVNITDMQKAYFRFKGKVAPLTQCRLYADPGYRTRRVRNSELEVFILLENESLENDFYLLRAISLRDTREHRLMIDRYEYFIDGVWIPYDVLVAEDQSNGS